MVVGEVRNNNRCCLGYFPCGYYIHWASRPYGRISGTKKPLLPGLRFCPLVGRFQTPFG